MLLSKFVKEWDGIISVSSEATPQLTIILLVLFETHSVGIGIGVGSAEEVDKQKRKNKDHRHHSRAWTHNLYVWCVRGRFRVIILAEHIIPIKTIIAIINYRLPYTNKKAREAFGKLDFFFSFDFECEAEVATSERNKRERTTSEKNK